MSDLKSKTVEELRKWAMSYFAETNNYTVIFHAFDEIARRLEEAQQKIVAQQVLINAIRPEASITKKISILQDTCYTSSNREAMTLIESCDAVLAAHDAEVAAKALEEARIGIDTIDDGEQPAYRHCQEYLGEKAAEYRAKAKQ